MSADRSAAQGREFCISCGEPVEGEWCPEPCHTDLRDSNNRVTCRRKHGVCNCPDCCGVRRSRATDPNLSDIPLHIRIAEDVQNARSAATVEFEEQHAHHMHILGLIRDDHGWSLSRILLAERLEEAVSHVIADSPGTPETVKGYLRTALRGF